MKVPPFDPNKQAWDCFKRFHILTGPAYRHRWVQFESGEIYFTCDAIHARHRGHYSSNEISIVSTADPKLSLSFARPDDDERKPIPRSQLNASGQQVLVIDQQYKRAVRLSRNTNLTPVGLNLAATAYCPGDGCEVVGGAPVQVKIPPSYSVRRELDELRNKCRVWWTTMRATRPMLRLNVVPLRRQWSELMYVLVENGIPLEKRPHGIADALYDGDGAAKWENMSNVQRAAVAEDGFNKHSFRRVTKYDHLVVLD